MALNKSHSEYPARSGFKKIQLPLVNLSTRRVAGGWFDGLSQSRVCVLVTTTASHSILGKRCPETAPNDWYQAPPRLVKVGVAGGA